MFQEQEENFSLRNEMQKRGEKSAARNIAEMFRHDYVKSYLSGEEVAQIIYARYKNID